MPPYGSRGNPFAPTPPRRGRRVAGRVAATLVPAVVGGLVALGGAVATGVLDGGGTTTVVRDGDPLPVAATIPAAPAPALVAGGDGDRLSGVQGIVRRAAPAVVKVTSSEDAGGRLGSGFLADARGRILTNAHVLGEGDTATLTFDDGSEVDARVLGRDESTDLAVLQADRVPPGVRALPLGTSEGLEVGDPVVAIGNPFGLERTATVGIVSALKRVIDAPNAFPIQNAIQTDAAINQGNSGGPLLDHTGQVIGINSQIASESGGNDGIGFAVPSDTIRPVADAIIATGRPEHAWVGVRGLALTPELATRLGVPGRRGVVVVEVDDRGPAKAAGLREAADPESEVPAGADLIVAVDGRPVTDMAEVSQAVSSRRVGDALTLTVLRDGERRPLRLTLADRPDDVGLRP